MDCAKCRINNKICRKPDGNGPQDCPTKAGRESIDKSLTEYQKSENAQLARMASVQEGECYAKKGEKPFARHPVKPRLQEIIEFAQKMGYAKIGIAFCSGLSYEASILSDLLEKHGFEIVSVACKVGGIPKEKIGISENEKVNPGNFESMCNPISQANLLNEKSTELNIMLGLCVGHDSLFLKYVEAPTTVFAVKDRVTGHNPLVSLYTLGSYSERFIKRNPEQW
ncbi:MAG: DUF1847 domain-containing protein [Spirochaetota bacterium]|nr:DUF1847 domain-containing protein [Spirochaetota bacterium]